MITFSEEEMKILRRIVIEHDNYEDRLVIPRSGAYKKPDTMTDEEWANFLKKLK